MARWRRRAARAGAHEFLDRAVLQRMERHHGEAATRRQHLLGSGEAAFELAQFVVDRDAQRLEDARGGIALVPGCGADRAAYDPTKMALFSDILFSTGFETGGP